jgi:hypothetical protein
MAASRLKDDPPVLQLGALIRREGRWLAALFLLALLVRVPGLGRADLWGDEILFVGLASPPLTPGGVLTNFWKQFLSIGHLPFGALLHNLLVWPFAGLVEDVSRAAALQRVPALLFGSLQVPLLFVLAQLVATRRVAVAAALLMGLLAFPVYFAREAYFYAPLMFLATASGLAFLLPILNGRLTRGTGWSLLLLLAATSLTHVNGASIGVAAFVITTGCLLVNRYPGPATGAAARALFLRLWGITLLGTLAAAPFFLQKLGKPSTMHFQQQPGLFEIFSDFTGKTFLGVLQPWVALAWIVLAFGLWAVVRREAGRSERLLLFGLLAIPFLIILVSAHKTLYFARYFSGVLGFYYLVLAMGLDRLVAWLGLRVPSLRTRADRWVPGLALLIALPHLVLFLPQVYRLPAKGVDYGGIARWLNQHLAPGTPYVMESAYELRFTSGYFPTPDLVPAAPYVHGAGAVEMQRLRERQKAFFLDYPEAAYIESARHGIEAGAPFPPWAWPHEHFRQRYDLINLPMQRLAAWGLWPQSPGRQVSVIQYHTVLLWNTPADTEARLRAEGRPVIFHFPDWQVRPIQQGEYARLVQSPRGGVLISNLTDRPVRGRMMLEGAIAGPARSFDVSVTWMGQPVGSLKQMGGQLWSMETGELPVPRGAEGRLEWGLPAEQAAGLQALILRRLRFVPSAP